ncbi:alpha-2-macroglobulin family protein [Pontibacter beigongshangensis]|uniref:alpha-2-macroglobulin family protein n=1 Tax=Pontibacter beigongshangensis TaxID=2574733 RepID=UPI00164F7F1E|nr:alpha-2-macroglobulin family protein [Pontibacter beigongshangensis]
MHLLRQNNLKLLLLFILLFFAHMAAAQQQSAIERLTFKIDSLAGEGLPKSALAEVEKLDQLARRQKNVPQQVRATIYRITFMSYLEEDALAKIVNQLRTDVAAAAFPVKPVLQSLLADVYWRYYQQNRYRISERSKLATPDADFTNWDLYTLVQEVARQHHLALQEQKRLQNTRVNVFEGVLVGDAATRYLRPTLYDLLLHRALDFFLTDEASLLKPKEPFTLNNPALFSDSRTFANLPIQTTDTASFLYQGIRQLQQATLFHLQQQHNQEALADLDLKRLELLFRKTVLPNKEKLYVQSLQQLAQTFAAKPISADALVQLGKFYQQKDSLTVAIDYFRKAQNAFPESLGGRNAANSIKDITQKTLSAEFEHAVAPGKPVLASVAYRNIAHVNATLYKLTEQQLAQLQKLLNAYVTNSRTGRTDIPSKEVLALLAQQVPEQNHRFSLSGTADYRQHRTELMLNPLPKGQYALLLQEPQSTDTSLFQLGTFQVTDLAYVSRINPNEQVELRVLHRDTGEPLAGVEVRADYLNHRSKNPQEPEYVNLATLTSDKDGKVVFSKKEQTYNFRIRLKSGTDTYTDGDKSFWGTTRREVEEEKEEEKTILFTDRQIYRPGQTIYFKGLQLKTLNGKSSLVAGAEIEVELSDSNYKTIGELELVTNEFGTFSGSFVLPQTVLPGEFTLETDDGELTVQVEEYKRPSFEITFQAYKENPRLNDSVTVKGDVMAFSGYGLSQAQVNYTITRRLYNPWPYRDFGYRSFPRQEPVIIQTGTLTTTASGAFEIRFRASADDVEQKEGQVYVYSLEADATDASGETRQATTEVKAGNKPVLIKADMPENLFGNQELKGTVSLTNLNDQLQPGKVQVCVFALQQPERMYKNRLWSAPDQPLLTQEEYGRNFPAYPYPGADDWRKWPRQEKVLEQTISTSYEKPAALSVKLPKNQRPGLYLVQLQGRNAQGDTVSLNHFFTFVKVKNNKPVKTNDWVVPLVTAGKAGEEAEFLVGTGTPGHFLMEVYEGPEIVKSEWVKTKQYQVLKKVRLKETGQDAQRVQFLLVQDNRSYSSSHELFVLDSEEQLQVKFSTFRNILQPGDKEQWKLQISQTGNKKAMAEMVATLYDASLNMFMPDQNWLASFGSEYTHRPAYFNWNSNNFVDNRHTQPLQHRYSSFGHSQRQYEHLNLFGYNYYGGYNYGYRQYLRQVEERQKTAAHDKLLEEEYKKNAAQIKHGYNVNGRVVGLDGVALPGVAIQLKGTQISTISNSRGYFKFKVPAGGVLQFSFVGFDAQEVTIEKAGTMELKLVPDQDNLQEVVVVGYGEQKRSNLTGSVATITVRGKASIYGSRAANGDLEEALAGQVAGVAASHPVVESEALASPAPAIRRNFQETAFFFPHLRTDKKGEILLEFTVPDALTRWKFKGLAHTQELKLGYLEQEVVTQKQLMVSAHMPRFFREGDSIIVTARLANLTKQEQQGTVQLHLFNALKMQPISLLVSAEEAQQEFTLAAGTNQAVLFRLAIPAGLEAITYRLTAETDRFSDGEENTLPVLTNRMLVTESMPLLVRPGEQKAFSFDKLVNTSSSTLQHKSLTLEYTPNPAWYAVQALPYLMEFPYDCAEQVFSRYFANSLASAIVQQQPVIRQVFAQWQQEGSEALLSNLEKNPELKAVLLEETPWLRDATSEKEQKQRISLLFDLNRMQSELQVNLEKLAQMQLPDGSFPWFRGIYPDRFITQHILAGIGQLQQLQEMDGRGETIQIITKSALQYVEQQLLEDERRKQKLQVSSGSKPEAQLNRITIHAWYTRSYFASTPLSAELQPLWKAYQQVAATEWKFRSIYEQGLIALTMHRFQQPEVVQQIIKSLLETVTRSEEMGMYWHQNKLGYFWHQAPVETQVLLIELFTEAGVETALVEEMKIWLLQHKRTNNWRTTKATAAACYALLLRGQDWLVPAAAPAITLAGQPLTTLKPDLAEGAGTGYMKASWAGEEIKPAMGKVEVKSNSNTISWGALHWQYLEQLDKITSSDTNIKLRRQYFIEKQTDAGKVLTAVDAAHTPKVGDVLKVVVYLTADREFEYVHLKDMRPAGTEPLDVLSGYKHQDGLYYYQTTKDVATNFFLNRLSKGNFVFEYRLRVAHAGEFSTGISSVQSMYAPEFNAHSEGQRLRYVK